MLAPYKRTELGGELRGIAFRVVIEPEAAPERLLHVVNSQEDSFRVGRIVSMGVDVTRTIPELHVGDRVLYAQAHSCVRAVEGLHIVNGIDHVLAIIDSEVRTIEAKSNAPVHNTEVHFETFGVGKFTSGRRA